MQNGISIGATLVLSPHTPWRAGTALTTKAAKSPQQHYFTIRQVTSAN